MGHTEWDTQREGMCVEGGRGWVGWGSGVGGVGGVGLAVHSYTVPFGSSRLQPVHSGWCIAQTPAAADNR
jgi:hypothetical protein